MDAGKELLRRQIGSNIERMRGIHRLLRRGGTPGLHEELERLRALNDRYKAVIGQRR